MYICHYCTECNTTFYTHTYTVSSKSETTPPPTTADTREGGSNVGGVVAGVIVSLLFIIGATLCIIAAIWLMRRWISVYACAPGMFFHNYTMLCVLCRKKSTLKGLFSMGHFKVTHKRRTSPHSRDAQDISLNQLSSESILYWYGLRLVSILFSAGESLAGGELSSEKDEVKIHFQSHSDCPSQQPATVQAIPYLSYLADEEVQEEEEEEEEEEEADPVPKLSAKFHARPVPLPVALFGSNVEKKHTNNNQPFMTEFEVSPNIT